MSSSSSIIHQIVKTTATSTSLTLGGIILVAAASPWPQLSEFPRERPPNSRRHGRTRRRCSSSSSVNSVRRSIVVVVIVLMGVVTHPHHLVVITATTTIMVIVMAVVVDIKNRRGHRPRNAALPRRPHALAQVDGDPAG